MENEILKINNLVHEPSRLLIISILSKLNHCDFNYLLSVSSLTKGNLSSHLSKLADGGIVEISKGFEGKLPKTTIKLTTNGRAIINDYKKDLKNILKLLS